MDLRAGPGLIERGAVCAGSRRDKKSGWLSSDFRLSHPRMGSLKKRRKAKINKHKRRKKLRLHRHKKRTWQK
jgi:hypothetical protein